MIGRRSTVVCKNSTLRWVLAGLALCLTGGPAGAQELPERPKIGIAFSGGGAKGCAHIGVLKVLEEMRIPVDFIAGTSMGSIVGGLYATGMDPEELTDAILTVDWADALRDKPGRKDLVFRRKDDDLRYIPDLEFGLGRGGLKYPTGLRSGQKLNGLLEKFTLPVRTVTDFDDLPTPFRAVATEIATGEMVVLDHGSLAKALRASMAIPTVFTPIEIDGRLLVDGGVTNNVPVDVVRAMGADVVIAIDIGAQFADEEAVGKSFLSILGQTNRMITRGNMIARLAQADIVIAPDIAGIGTLEFEKGHEIIERGVTQARAQADELRPYALSEAEYAAWKASRHREPDPIPVITEVRFEGNEQVDTRVLEAQVEVRTGQSLDPEAVRRDLSSLYGLGDFETVGADLEELPDGGTAIVFQMNEKPWGPTYLRVGLGVQADFEGENDLSLGAAINRTRINPLGAEWKTELQFGNLRVAQTSFYQPLSFDSGWFVDPGLYYRRRDLTYFVSGEGVAELDVQTTGGRLDLGYTFGRYGEARLGLVYDRITPRRQSGFIPPTLGFESGETYQRGGFSLRAVADRLDSATLPKNGSIVRLTGLHTLDALGADDEYTKLQLRYGEYRTWGRNTFFGGLDTGYSPDELPLYDRFYLGGLFSLSAFEFGELSGDNFGVARLGYYYRLGKVLHVGGFVEAAGASADYEKIPDNVYTTLTGILVADTAFGPFYIAFGQSEEGRRKAYILFGRQF
jgi:NTE family protein